MTSLFLVELSFFLAVLARILLKRRNSLETQNNRRVESFRLGFEGLDCIRKSQTNKQTKKKTQAIFFPNSLFLDKWHSTQEIDRNKALLLFPQGVASCTPTMVPPRPACGDVFIIWASSVKPLHRTLQKTFSAKERSRTYHNPPSVKTHNRRHGGDRRSMRHLLHRRSRSTSVTSTAAATLCSPGVVLMSRVIWCTDPATSSPKEDHRPPCTVPRTETCCDTPPSSCTRRMNAFRNCVVDRRLRCEAAPGQPC